MQLFPYLLVILSAITHGIWNFLAKRSARKDIFIGLSKLAEATIFLVPFLFVLRRYGFGSDNWYVYVVIAAGFVFLNYYFLAQAYQHLDLSVAYPIARASTLFLPILAYLFINETIDLIGLFSLVLITVAVLGIQLDSFDKRALSQLLRNLARPGIVFALLAALTVAAYTIWDKVAITQLPPFLYFYSYTALTSLFYFFYLRLRFPRAAIQKEWQQNKRSIIAVAILNTFTYLLVLVALDLSKATYVGALRQVSLIVGVLLGWKILKEPLPLPRIISVILLLIGSGLIAFAR